MITQQMTTISGQDLQKKIMKDSKNKKKMHYQNEGFNSDALKRQECKQALIKIYAVRA